MLLNRRKRERERRNEWISTQKSFRTVPFLSLESHTSASSIVTSFTFFECKRYNFIFFRKLFSDSLIYHALCSYSFLHLEPKVVRARGTESTKSSFDDELDEDSMNLTHFTDFLSFLKICKVANSLSSKNFFPPPSLYFYFFPITFRFYNFFFHFSDSQLREIHN